MGALLLCGFGWSDQRIAARLDVKWETVLVWLRRFRETGRPVRPSAALRRQRVAELVARGLTPMQIAEELGASRHTVHDDCCRLGLTRGRARKEEGTPRDTRTHDNEFQSRR